jgi:hypothetical protein
MTVKFQSIQAAILKSFERARQEALAVIKKFKKTGEKFFSKVMDVYFNSITISFTFPAITQFFEMLPCSDFIRMLHELFQQQKLSLCENDFFAIKFAMLIY